MIRKSIEPGTEVIHNEYGFGKIIENFGDDSVKVSFYLEHKPKVLIIHSGKLTEIKSESFNPPV